MENLNRSEPSAEPSKALEVPPEVRALVAAVATAALEGGRAAEAEKVLEGLVAVHPRDATSWALLARAHLQSGKGLAARFAAAVGVQLAPEDPGVRLAHAEVRLGDAESRSDAIEELRRLRPVTGAVGERASALVLALGEAGV